MVFKDIYIRFHDLLSLKSRYKAADHEKFLAPIPKPVLFLNRSHFENLGSEKIIYTHINGTEIRIKSTKNIKDKNITIYLPKNKLYLFDNNKNRLKT